MRGEAAARRGRPGRVPAERTASIRGAGRVLIGRLIRLVVLLALLLGALAILLSVVVQPFVERQASSAIGKQLGTKVSVDAGSVFSLGVIKGDVGPLKVHADTFKR